MCFDLPRRLPGWHAIVALGFSAPYPRNLYLRAKPWADRLAGTLMELLGLRLVSMRSARDDPDVALLLKLGLVCLHR
jgi:hypothetical protein